MRLGALRNLFTRHHHGGALDGALAEAALASGAMDTAHADDIHATRGAAAAPPPDGTARSPPSRWSQQRLEIVEELWGDGFLAPGGAEEILRLAAPLGLSAASSVLLIGAGAGGPPRALATERGAWVSAFDADPVLVSLATRRILRAGAAQAKRATVATWKPDAPSFPHKGFHHAVVVDALTATTLQPTLTALADAIKPGGQLMLVQTVIDPTFDATDPTVAAWRRLDPTAADPPMEAAVTNTLIGLGFDVRIVESQSLRHIRQALQGWKSVLRSLRGPRPTPAYAAALVAEAELWMRRLRLMHTGQVHHMRWHAIGGS